MLRDSGWFHHALSGYDTNVELVISECMKLYQQNQSRLKVDWKGHKVTTNVYCRGTVLSGSCTKTTLGNTLRVALYWKLLVEQLGYTTNWLKSQDQEGVMVDVYIHVAGDDVQMFARQSVA